MRRGLVTGPKTARGVAPRANPSYGVDLVRVGATSCIVSAGSSYHLLG